MLISGIKTVPRHRAIRPLVIQSAAISESVTRDGTEHKSNHYATTTTTRLPTEDGFNACCRPWVQ